MNYIAREHGVNYYEKATNEDFTKACEYWNKTNQFWSIASHFWEGVEARQNQFSIAKEVDGETLTKELLTIARGIADENKATPKASEVQATVQPFLTRCLA